MISLELAQQLKTAGIEWHPSLHDFFAIPDVDLDRKVFIVNDMMAEVEVMGGRKAITFHGVVEWALDYVLPVDAVWLPQEAQLRELLLDTLGASGSVTLTMTNDGCRCEVRNDTLHGAFDADTAADAYALTLLSLVETESGPYLNGR